MRASEVVNCGDYGQADKGIDGDKERELPSNADMITERKQYHRRSAEVEVSLIGSGNQP